MRFSRLSMENLGPYYGRHEVDLKVAEATPVVLIHGENMRGKSSLFNAIKWALYGSAVGRRGRVLPSVSLMSLDAIEEGDFHMLVELDFEHDGIEYRLERQVQASSLPQSDRDLRMTVSMRRQGHFVATEDVDRIVADILHPDISRFFFFDGEMLSQYEVLLSEAGRESDLVRQSIEQILGLPALHLIADDVAEARRDAAKRLLKGAEVEKRNDAVVASVRQTSDELEATERDVRDLQALRETAYAERDGLTERLEQFGEIRSDLRELDQLDIGLKEARDRQKSAQEECRALLRVAWWMPLARLAAEKTAALDEAVRDASAHIDHVTRLKASRDKIRESRASSTCVLCQRGLDAPTESTLADAEAAIVDELGKDVADHQDLSGLLAQRDVLAPYSNDEKLERLAGLERQYRRAGLDIRRLEQQAEGVKERVKNHDRAEIAATEIQHEQCVRQILKLDSSIQAGETRSVELHGKLSRLQQQIAEAPGADPRLAVEASLYSGLSYLLLQAVAGFREQLRLQVETEASEIFRAMTTEPDYAGLHINDRYGLTIVDSRGREIRERSAGAEQVVALALIGGLNRSATRQAPVVMDTPFGRLDTRHRENVLRFVPTLGTQVILLVQSGELDRERDLRFVEGVIGREYMLFRDGPTRSHIAAVD